MTSRARCPEARAQERGDPAGVLAVGRDDEARRVGLLAAHLDAAGRARRRAPSGSHSPSSESAVRSRWLARAASSGSSKVAAWSVPSGADHSICAVRRREEDRPDDPPVGERVAVAVLEVGHRLARRCR